MNRIVFLSLAGSLIPFHALAAQRGPDPWPVAFAPFPIVFALEPAESIGVTTQNAWWPLAAPSAGAPSARPLVVRTAEQDFLFGPPAVSIGIRGGLSLPRAQSDIFALVTDTLTAERSDFQSFALSLDLAIRLSSRIDLVLGIARAAADTRTEYRNWVDQDDLPIEQTTRLQRVPVTAGAKVYLTSRGRQVGEFAWIPARVAFYATGGGGLVHYRFEQEGDFVDFRDLGIFDATYESSGWGPTAYLGLGGDLRLTPATFLSLEARGAWASAELGRDFVGFDPIDLSGLQITLGLHRSL